MGYPTKKTSTQMIQHYDYNYHDESEDNAEEIKKIQKILEDIEDRANIEGLHLDEKLKEKVNKIVLPMLGSTMKENKGEEGGKARALKQTKPLDKKDVKSYSVSRIL